MPLTPQEFRQKYLELNAYYRALQDKMPDDMIPDELKQTMDALKQKYVSIVTNIEPTPEQQPVAQEMPSQPVEQPESDVDLSGITLSTKDLFNADKRTLGALEGNINKLSKTLLVKNQDPEFYKRITAEVKLLQNENLPANARLKLIQSLQNDLQNAKRYAAEYNARIKTTEEFSKSRGQRAVAGLVAGFGNGLIKEFSLNYMDLLKESMKHAPKEMQGLLKKIQKSGSFKAGENIGHFVGMLPVITAYENILKLPKIGEFISNAASKYQLPEWFAKYITNTPKNLVLGIAYGATRKTEKGESRLDAIRNDAIGFALFSFLMDTMGSGFKFLKKAKSAKEIAKIIEEHSNIPPEQARSIGELYYEWQFLSPNNVKKLNEIERTIKLRDKLDESLTQGDKKNAESVGRKVETGSTEEVSAGQEETGRLRVRNAEETGMEARQGEAPPEEDVKAEGAKEKVKAQEEKINPYEELASNITPDNKKNAENAVIEFAAKSDKNTVDEALNYFQKKIDEAKANKDFTARSKYVYAKDMLKQASGRSNAPEHVRLKVEELRKKYSEKPEITPESKTKAKPIETTPKEEKPVERKSWAEKQPWEITKEEANAVYRSNFKIVDGKYYDPGEYYFAKEHGREPTQIDKKRIEEGFRDNLIGHKKAIEQALKEGKPVPPEVLKDYPELIKQYKADLPRAETVTEPSDKGQASPAFSEKQKLSGKEFTKGLIKNIAKDLNDPTQLSSNFAREYKHVKEFLRNYGIELTDSEKEMLQKFIQDIMVNKKLSDYERLSKIGEFVNNDLLKSIHDRLGIKSKEWTKLNRKMHMLAHKKNIGEEELHSVLKEVSGKESFKDASEKEIEKVIYEISKSPRAKYEERERKILASIKDKGLKRQYAEILKRRAKIREKFEKVRRKANALGREVSIFALKGGGYVKGLFGKLQDARYAFANAEANTGLPFFDTYEKIVNSARLVRHRTTQLLNGLFEGTGLKPEDVLNNRKSQARIAKYLVKGEKEGLSEGELKLAENIKKSLQEFESTVRKARFMLWMKDPVSFHIPNAKREDLLYGKRLYFSKGEKALDEWLAKQTWGTRKNYLPSVFEHLANLEDYNTWFSRSKGFARTRRGEYYSNIPLFRALRRYYMNVLSYQHLDPLKKDLMKLLDEAHAANSDLKDLREWWKRLNGINEYTEITKFLNTVRGWAWKSILNNNMFIYARNLFQNYALLFQKLGIIPTIRNIHKTLLFSKTPKIKNLSKEELDALSEYFKFHVAELNAILNDYMFIEPEMPKFELTRKMNKILEYLPKKYAQTDLLNRAAAFRIVYENADHYLKKYAKGKISDSKLFLNTGVYNLTNAEQERLIELLAKKKYSEFKQELARRIVDNTHFKYTRYEKGLAEQAPSMQFILDTATWWKGNLQNLYKGGIERMAEGIRKKNYREAYSGLRTLVGYVVAAYGANKMMDIVLGEGKSRYGFDPFVYGLGGVGLGTTGKLFDIPNFAVMTSKKELMKAIGKDVDPATAYKWAEARYSIDTLFKMIPFLDYGIRAYESLNDKANVSFWKEFKYHILKDHAHNRESIARRNAVEAWRHFIFGTDVKKLKRKPNVLNIY